MLPMSWVTNPAASSPSPFRVVETGIWGHGAQGKLPYSSEGEWLEVFATKGLPAGLSSTKHQNRLFVRAKNPIIRLLMALD
jgi:hypothetical protein